MTEKSEQLENDHAQTGYMINEQQSALAQLRYYSWQAALLLFTPWLVSLFLCLRFFQNEQMLILALLPGFAVALHIQVTLYRTLHLNYSVARNNLLFSTLGIANWITLCRAAAIVALAGFLPITLWDRNFSASALGWVPGCLYLTIALTDLLDGFAARKTKRITELGKRLDIETDAAGLITASLIAIALHRVPALYCLVGIAYYLFSAGIWFRRKRQKPIRVLLQRPYSRIIAGFQMGLVATVLLPLFRPIFTHIAAILFMAPLLLGFFRDWLVVSCRIQTDSNQTTALDTFSGTFCMPALRVLLRLAIFLTGIYTIISFPKPTSLSWLAAYSILCLMAVLGFMGRSSCLMLILLLAIHQSPFGATIDTIFSFASATLLMLMGIGSISLWSPEENFLYRRFQIK